MWMGGWLSGLGREESKYPAHPFIYACYKHFTYDVRLHQGPVMVLYMGERGSNEKVVKSIS